MRRLKILFDADDTVENLQSCWLNALNQKHGTSVTVEDITDWDVSLSFPTLSKEEVLAPLQDDALWSSLERIPGSLEVLQRLYSEGHELYMVTASDYRTCPAKFNRILSLFPFLDWQHVIVSHNKQMIRGDFLIDDAPHNLIGGEYVSILFDRPHNRNFDAAKNGIIRVYNWDEVYSVITHSSAIKDFDEEVDETI